MSLGQIDPGVFLCAFVCACDPQRGHYGALWGHLDPHRITIVINGGYIRPTKKKFGHSTCATLHAHGTMPRQKRFTREEVLQQLFSQQTSSEPESDQEADGQGD